MNKLLAVFKRAYIQAAPDDTGTLQTAFEHQDQTPKPDEKSPLKRARRDEVPTSIKIEYIASLPQFDRMFIIMRSFLAFAAVFVTLQSAAADNTADQAPYERVLVPLMATAAVPGAYGSLWVPYLTVRNDGDLNVDVSEFPNGLCVSSCAAVAPRTTSLLGFATPNANGGVFLYIGNPGKGTVSFSLRIQDRSRESLTFGTVIPVVREKDVTSSRLEILDVPIDAGFRDALRIYDFDSDPEVIGVARIRIYDNESSTALVDGNLSLTTPGHAYVPPAYPAFAMIGNLLETYPQLANAVDPSLPPGSSLPPRVRIVIEPVSAGLRFWGFVTVAHNETQHVTALLPSQ